MRTRLVMTLAVTGLLAALGGIAQAQPQVGAAARRPNYGPGYRGNISPYLNLQRGNVGIDYFLGVRSEQQRRQDAREFRAEIGELASREAALDAQGGFTSGTQPLPNTMQKYFNNTGGYFPPVAQPRR